MVRGSIPLGGTTILFSATLKSMRIIIVGGGFAGVRVALDLAKYKNSNSKIVLISDTSHFEYHPALYRVVTGRSPLEVCIPLQDIFQGKNTEIVCDSITNVDISNHQLKGASGSTYHYDILILALGSETVYFNVPGLREYSFGFKSIQEALKLKR
ncbi:FAD-dependent oxidoreductase, partial [Candidatus Roizmanbacteria bacterium]|nr:FAD-dependent oxidoreductase [Candidatus Roizmanbacteria bacterium]